MIVSESEILSVLVQFNPWWRGARVPDLPSRRRLAYKGLLAWLREPPARRALLLSGARQIGKTTLLLQAAEGLIQEGVPPERILYATFDHPLLKLAGIEFVVNLWQSARAPEGGPAYLLLDEIQAVRDWQVWLKHQVDFGTNLRIAATGSATPLVTEGQESGVGRWHTMRLPTLSFFEYLEIKGAQIPAIPTISGLDEVFEWSPVQIASTAKEADPLAGHFHEFLLRGGFPQAALTPSVSAAQRLLREDIVDKVLKRDMTALFGVRHVVELEHVFLYLCLHGGGILDVQALCQNLELKKPTVLNFLSLLEATHLVYRLRPFGYGKEVLRGRFKVYLADPSIAPSVMLKGQALLEDAAALGVAVETAIVSHLDSAFGAEGALFTYWMDRRDREVDVIVEQDGKILPIEVKYRSQKTGAGEFEGLLSFCGEKGVKRAIAITRFLGDFSVVPLGGGGPKVLKVPAALGCFWLGAGLSLA